jgi:DNA-binding transcriptional LysR family regulator
MEIRVLRYFLTVAREGNITRASEILHITQPTLSRQLAQLEEELGVTLFLRGQRKLRLTDEGMLLRQRASEIISLVDKTNAELTSQEEVVDGCIAIGSGELASVGKLAQLCGSFRERYPKVRFDWVTATADCVRENMERGALDLGLLLEPIDMAQFDFIRFDSTERWCVVMLPDSPLATKLAIAPTDLLNIPLVLPRRLSVQSELANWFGEYFEHIHIAYTEDLATNGVFLVQQGYAYSLAIQGSVINCDPARIVTRPLLPDLHAHVVLAWRRNTLLPLACQKFIKYAKEQLITAC